MVVKPTSIPLYTAGNHLGRWCNIINGYNQQFLGTVGCLFLWFWFLFLSIKRLPCWNPDKIRRCMVGMKDLHVAVVIIQSTSKYENLNLQFRRNIPWFSIIRCKVLITGNFLCPLHFQIISHIYVPSSSLLSPDFLSVSLALNLALHVSFVCNLQLCCMNLFFHVPATYTKTFYLLSFYLLWISSVILFPIAITFYITWWFIHFVDGFFSPIYAQLGINIFGIWTNYFFNWNLRFFWLLVSCNDFVPFRKRGTFILPFALIRIKSATMLCSSRCSCI